MGLSVIHEQLTTKMWAVLILDSLFFSIGQFIIVSRAQIVLYILGIIVFAISYIGFLFLFFTSVKDSLKILVAHMVMLQAKGINPEHTPTSRKCLMIDRMMRCGAVTFLVFAVSTVLAIPEFFPFWIHYLLDTIAKETLFGCMCWTCRIRSKMVALYGEGEEEYQVGEHEELMDWVPGMVLPPLPGDGCSRYVVRLAPS
jgi:hypothetical protein